MQGAHAKVNYVMINVRLLFPVLQIPSHIAIASQFEMC